MHPLRPRGSTQITIPCTPVLRPSDADLNPLVEMINAAKTVAIFPGDGCRDGRDEVLQLADRLKAFRSGYQAGMPTAATFCFP
jgi:pyruvate dehydrogenase (quinone)